MRAFNRQNVNGWSPLGTAVKEGKKELVMFFLNKELRLRARLSKLSQYIPQDLYKAIGSKERLWKLPINWSMTRLSSY
jgi:hypothetical protein